MDMYFRCIEKWRESVNRNHFIRFNLFGHYTCCGICAALASYSFVSFTSNDDRTNMSMYLRDFRSIERETYAFCTKFQVVKNEF